MRDSPSSSRPTTTTPKGTKAARTADRPPARTRKKKAAATPSAARLRVREAAPADAPVIAELRWSSDVQHAESLPDYFRAPPRGLRAVPRSSASQRVLVVEDDVEKGASVRGYLVLHLTMTPPDPASVPGPRARVDAVVVERSARRRGAGRVLMEKAASMAREFGAAELVLTVWQGNEGASAFYEALGFEPLARVLRQRLKRV